jgi:hypothetical protein
MNFQIVITNLNAPLCVIKTIYLHERKTTIKTSNNYRMRRLSMLADTKVSRKYIATIFMAEDCMYFQNVGNYP